MCWQSSASSTDLCCSGGNARGDAQRAVIFFVLFCFDWMVSSRHAPRAKRSAFLALALGAAVVLVCGEMCGGEGASEGAEVLTAARSGLLTGLHMAMGRPSP